MDRTNCPDVGRVLGRLSGAYVAKGTPIPADGIVDNAAHGYEAAGLFVRLGG